MDELQVFFCDLCNASIPEADIELGRARRFRDKVIGACCLGELRDKREPAKPARSGGVFTACLVSLVAVAGAAMFLEWRLAEESTSLRSTVRGVRADLDPLDDRLIQIETRLASTLTGDALEGVEQRVAGFDQGLAATETRIVESIRGNATRMRDLAAQITALDGGQRDHLARIAELHGEIRRVADRVDELVIAARTPPPAIDLPVDSPAPIIADDSPPPLPPELQRLTEQLEDPDDGARFEAVDELLQSGDARVFPYVLALAKDPDAFVRRLVLEGLKDYRHADAVDALIEALGDSESLVRYTAHASLKALTAQDIAFDPDASPNKRASMQRRWQDWWQKNRDGLF